MGRQEWVETVGALDNGRVRCSKIQQIQNIVLSILNITLKTKMSLQLHTQMPVI